MAEKSLKDKAKSGMVWSFLIQGGNQLINFTVSVILARILLPRDFGLVGMIAVFIAISKALVNGGFSTSLIRAEKVDNRDYSTVFFINIATSLLLYLILFATAPWVSAFYEAPILTELIRVLGIVLLVNAFSIVQSTKLNRSLDFKTQFKLQFPALLASAGISIWMAHTGYGVWSLVARDLSYAFFATVQLWLYGKWMPQFAVDRAKLKYHFNFGYKLSLTQIITTLFDNFYKIIIGKLFSAAQLGFYTRAKSLMELPSGFFVAAFNRVAFPLLASIGKDRPKLRSIYSRLMKVLAFIVTPILVFMWLVAEPLIQWLLTEKWLPAVPYFRILLFAGLFYPIRKYNLNICNVRSRSDLILKLSIIENCLLLIGACTVFVAGIYGLLYSYLVVNIVVTMINAYYSGRLIEYGLVGQVKDVLPSFLTSIFCGILLYIVNTNYLTAYDSLMRILVVGSLFFLAYVCLSLFFNLKVVRDLNNLIRKK